MHDDEQYMSTTQKHAESGQYIGLEKGLFKNIKQQKNLVTICKINT